MTEKKEKTPSQLELEKIDAELMLLMTLTSEEEEAQRQQEIKDKTALLEAIKKHGKIGQRIHSINTGKGYVIVKTPALALWRGQVGNENPNEKFDKVVQNSLVYPTLNSYLELEKEFPALPEKLFMLCSYLAGYAMETTLSK